MPANITQIEVILRIFVAFVIGLSLGIERAIAGKDASIKTHTIICTGSAVFTVLGYLHGDPARVSAQIISGIGFLGAGVIWKDSDSGITKGLTSAAYLWSTTGVGMLAGDGKYLLAAVAAILLVLAVKIGDLFHSILEKKQNNYLS